MKKISLIKIKKEQNKITYEFSVSSELSQYFSTTPFFIEYPDNIEQVPDSIAAIPFVCCVAPLIWIEDGVLELEELDEDFYAALENIRQGFQEMYPEASWLGEVHVGSTIKNVIKDGNSASFYSGGIDSIFTLVNHISERPHLISIWGSDIDYNNEEGWEILKSTTEYAAKTFELPNPIIRSSFRAFDKEEECDKKYHSLLKKCWWYGVKHGIAIIGHAAPYVWLHNISNLYIASSNCPQDGVVRCASDPKIDNMVKFSGCSTYHDGFEANRQDKTQGIVDYFKKNKEHQIPLHVCWETQTGNNCCRCEKCFRTIVGLCIAKADPRDFGLSIDDEVWDQIYQAIALGNDSIPKNTWTYMRDALNRDWQNLKHDSNCKKLKWMRNFDFKDRESNACRRRSLRRRYLKRRVKNVFIRVFRKTK